MRDKLANQVQKALRAPATRPLPEDPFAGFRAPMFEHTLDKADRARQARKLAALVQACHEMHGRK